MAAKKDGKTNKTAHVLSLLTDPDEAKSDNSSQEEVTHTATPATPAPAAPPILEVVRSNDHEISGKIKDELEKEFEKELLSEISELHEEDSSKQQVVETREEPQNLQVETVSEQENSMPEVTPQENDHPQDIVEHHVEKPVEEPPKAQESVAAAKAVEPPEHPQAALDGINCVNVMQTLVEEKAGKYIKLFGLCDCPRCRIDVIALSLTKLPAKYVVVKKIETVPMLSVYEGRYNAAVISQVMWACKQVMDSPRHDL